MTSVFHYNCVIRGAHPPELPVEQRAEIGVLYDDKEYGSSSSPSEFRYGDRTLGGSLRGAIESAGIPVQWVSEDVHAKRLFDITRDSVVLSSVHSAKGLDFDLVYVIHPGWPEASRKDIRRRIEPTYVAITRAKYRLVVLYEREDQIIRRMARPESRLRDASPRSGFGAGTCRLT